MVTENRAPLLIDNITRLRASFRLCLLFHPFEIEAMVILPDYLHALWHLPEGSTDFSTRWMVIKRYFSAGFDARCINPSKARKREYILQDLSKGKIFKRKTGARGMGAEHVLRAATLMGLHECIYFSPTVQFNPMVTESVNHYRTKAGLRQ